MRKGSNTMSSAAHHATLSELEARVAASLVALRPCSAGIVVSRRGEVIFERYLEGVEPQQPRLPIDARALWPAFSTTKSYSAALLLSLAHEGLLALDDPVSRYLPAFAQPGAGRYSRRDVTLRHLASHTSGASLSREAMDIEVKGRTFDLADIHIVTPPGVDYLYSGLGMYLLERAVEAAAGRDWGELMRQRILDPLGLADTGYVYAYDAARPLLPCLPGDSPDPASHYVFVTKGGRAGSGLYATARDFNRFGQLWLGQGTFEGRAYFSPALQREAWRYHGMRASDNGRYGLLWWLFEDDGGYVMSGMGHVVVAVVPESGVVVTVARNRISHIPGPFDYYEDKRALVRIGKQLAL